MAHMWKSKNNFVGSVFSKHLYVASQDWAQAARLSRRTLYPLSYLTSPTVFFSDTVSHWDLGFTRLGCLPGNPRTLPACSIAGTTRAGLHMQFLIWHWGPNSGAHSCVSSMLLNHLPSPINFILIAFQFVCLFLRQVSCYLRWPKICCKIEKLALSSGSYCRHLHVIHKYYMCTLGSHLLTHKHIHIFVYILIVMVIVLGIVHRALIF